MPIRAAYTRLRHARQLHFSLELIAIWILLLGQWAPLDLRQITPGLDASWVAVLGEAAAGRYGFGSDIVFTGGPLSTIYTRYFTPEFLPTYLWASYAFLFALGFVLTAPLARRKERGLAAVLLMVLLCGHSRDAWLVFLPFATAFACFAWPLDRRSLIAALVGASATAIAVLAKFSVLPGAVLCFALIDGQRIAKDRLPVALPVFMAALYGFFELATPTGSDFRLFMKGALEMSAGYAEAMSTAGDGYQIATYLIVCAGAMALAAFVTWRRRISLLPRADDLLPMVALAALLWLGLKAGFVRQDWAHTGTAYSIAMLGIAAYIVSMRLSFDRNRWLAGIFLLLVGWSGWLVIVSYPPGRSADALAGERLLASPKELGRSFTALTSPGRWLDGLRHSRQSAIAATAAPGAQLGDLHDTIASVASLQSILLASGANYRPQPSIQQYASYTHDLIVRDRAFFERERPGYILFSPEAIDGRLSAFAEGSLWPFFLSNYAPLKLLGNFSGAALGDTLLLRRRIRPVETVLGEPVERAGVLNGKLSLPRPTAPFFVSVDVRQTWLGKLADVFFKPPPIHLGVTYADGTSRRFRFIPGMAREGFLVSPAIDNAPDFALLASSKWRDLKVALTIEVEADNFASLFYQDDIRYRIGKLDVGRLAEEARAEGLVFRDMQRLDNISLMKAMIRGNGGPTQTFKLTPDGIFAHPPRDILMNVDGIRALSLAYGVDTRNPDSRTNGVCFRVLARATRQPLWESCLAPKTEPADQGVHKALVELPTTVHWVILETDCRGNCGWDWAYWQKIDRIAREPVH